MSDADAALKAMQALLQVTDDPQQLRSICMELAQEVAVTRKEERKLWIIIHELQHENQALQTELLLKRDADSK
jgi:hypothetical protein